MTQTELREQRLEQFFKDCQNQVLSQIIGPFGLSTAMFEDKAGGNVTTEFNFEKGVVATEEDQKKFNSYQADLEQYTRGKYTLSSNEWDKKKAFHRESDIDGYTGKSLSESAGVDLDHIVPVHEISRNSRAHLGMNQEQMKDLVNNDANLTSTDAGLNRSKGAKDLRDWMKEKRSGSETTNAEHYEIDSDLAKQKYNQAQGTINKTTRNNLYKKQGQELLSTGGQQAVNMGLRQAMGLMLTELVNGLFNETKLLIREGVSPEKSLFKDISERFARVFKQVSQKLPDAISQMFQGGVNGFMSNLLTFFINRFVTTAKKVVRMIREGLLGLVKAFKLILFPPKNMSKQEALRAGLKALTAVVVTSVGFAIEESVSVFLTGIPVIAPIAHLVSPVMVGILTGLTTAFLAYGIDQVFDKLAYNSKEKLMDGLVANSKNSQQFASELASMTEAATDNIHKYAQSIHIYQTIGTTLGHNQITKAKVLSSLEHTNELTRRQIRKSQETIDFINESQSEIDDFLATI